MKSLWGRLSSLPLYPLWIGLFPVLSLAAYNLSQIDLSQAYRSLALSLAAAVTLFVLLRLALRDWQRAAFLTTAILVLFYSYGHAYNFLTAGLLKDGPFTHFCLLSLWALLFIAVGWQASRKTIQWTSITWVLNLFSVLLLIYPFCQFVRFEAARLPSHVPPINPQNPRIKQPPDIYYIILDAYDRADTLKMVYDYDDSGFLDELKRRGFYIAECSQSNYAYTQPSLASSLNMDYLDRLGIGSNAQADPRLQDNAVRRYLRAQGYTIEAFESGFAWSQWEDADVYYQYRPNPGHLNGFEALFLRTTLLRPLIDSMYARQDAAYGVIPYQRILYQLETLKKLPESSHPTKFVFAHLSIPHPPFVFGPNGEFVTAGAENATSLEGYRNSVRFINREILAVIDSLLARSDTPPVIILQGDHGAPLYHSPLERMTILNAYYLPGVKGVLYPSISPVNTFRVIWTEYFGDKVPLLPDISYYSYPNQEYEFGEIPNECGK